LDIVLDRLDGRETQGAVSKDLLTLLLSQGSELVVSKPAATSAADAPSTEVSLTIPLEESSAWMSGRDSTGVPSQPPFPAPRTTTGRGQSVAL